MYVEMGGHTFHGFESANDSLLEAQEAGRVKPGETVHTIWCGDKLEWVPLTTRQ